MNLGSRYYAVVLLALTWGFSPLWAEPNHLEPIEPYRNDYHQLVFNLLVGTREPECWMVCRPSFRPEYVVMLRKEELDAGKPDPFAGHAKFRWFLDTATAAQQIWHWKTFPNGKMELDLLRNVKVNRTTLEVTEAFGQGILNAWTAALQLTRYADEPNSGLDGVVYDFHSQSYYGTTWSPEKGIPADMVKLADLLYTLVHSESAKRLTLVEEGTDLARKILEASTEGRKKFNALPQAGKQ